MDNKNHIFLDIKNFFMDYSLKLKKLISKKIYIQKEDIFLYFLDIKNHLLENNKNNL